MQIPFINEKMGGFFNILIRVVTGRIIGDLLRAANIPSAIGADPEQYPNAAHLANGQQAQQILQVLQVPQAQQQLQPQLSFLSVPR